MTGNEEIERVKRSIKFLDKELKKKNITKSRSDALFRQKSKYSEYLLLLESGSIKEYLIKYGVKNDGRL